MKSNVCFPIIATRENINIFFVGGRYKSPQEFNEKELNEGKKMPETGGAQQLPRGLMRREGGTMKNGETALL